MQPECGPPQPQLVILFKYQNNHWRLYTDHCCPCLSNYTYIVDLDKEGEEEEVLNITGLSQVTNGSRVMNPTKGGGSVKVVKEYLSQLSCSTLVSLYERYWPDFVLFNYTMGEVVDRWVDQDRCVEL